jgi:hypothetical protein
MEEVIAQQIFPVCDQLFQSILRFPVRLPILLFGSVCNRFHLRGNLLEFFVRRSGHRSNLVVRVAVDKKGDFSRDFPKNSRALSATTSVQESGPQYGIYVTGRRGFDR